MRRTLHTELSFFICLILSVSSVFAYETPDRGAMLTTSPDHSGLAEIACSGEGLESLTAARLSDLVLPGDRPVPEASPPQDITRPVIITVPGLKFTEIGWGPLEFRVFLNLIKFLFPDKNPDTREFRQAFAEYNKEFNYLKEAADSADYGQLRSRPDNYIEVKLRELPKCAKATIIPFHWTRDPENTAQTVEQFLPRLEKVYDTYKNTGRPIYILAHSWGTVIMHDVLYRLSAARPGIRIDKFITMGSPLMPGNVIVELFKKLQISRHDLQARVRKPDSVRLWKNVWAKRDPFSNGIAAADSNKQIDTDMSRREDILSSVILHDPVHRAQAAKDLVSVINVASWHGAYLFDFRASLEYLGEDIYLPIFRTVVVPPLANCR